MISWFQLKPIHLIFQIIRLKFFEITLYNTNVDLRSVGSQNLGILLSLVQRCLPSYTQQHTDNSRSGAVNSFKPCLRE